MTRTVTANATALYDVSSHSSFYSLQWRMADYGARYTGGGEGRRMDVPAIKDEEEIFGLHEARAPAAGHLGDTASSVIPLCFRLRSDAPYIAVRCQGKGVWTYR